MRSPCLPMSFTPSATLGPEARSPGAQVTLIVGGASDLSSISSLLSPACLMETASPFREPRRQNRGAGLIRTRTLMSQLQSPMLRTKPNFYVGEVPNILPVSTGARKHSGNHISFVKLWKLGSLNSELQNNTGP